MRIERLEFWNKETGWRLSPTEFFPDLTLLVGVSGAGKSRILRTIETLAAFAKGEWLSKGQATHDFVGAKWDVTFSTEQGQYRWEGELAGGESLDFPNGFHDESLAPGQEIRVYEPLKLGEKLTCNGKEIAVIESETGTIRFKRHVIPKIAPLASVISLLRSDEIIKPVFESFCKIVFHDDIVAYASPRLRDCPISRVTQLVGNGTRHPFL